MPLSGRQSPVACTVRQVSIALIDDRRWEPAEVFRVRGCRYPRRCSGCEAVDSEWDGGGEGWFIIVSF